MLTLNDGRSELWQWDTGRKLTVDADCTQVHFSNKVFGRSIDMNVVDGIAIIPDILLQTDKDLIAWAFVGTAENGYTKISKVFKVNKRNKPADYVFTPPEQTSLEEIKEKIEYLESIQDPDAIKNAVDDYLANNPIKVEEKDPTVPAWAKQETKPKYTATEVGAVATVNGVKPDANGNVEIEVSGGNVDQTSVEPEYDDIPKIFFGGALQQTKTEAVVPFRYISKTDDFSGYAEIKAQGNSSMSYPKKNQTVKMFKDADCTEKMKVDFKGWGKQNKHAYKANWIDLTHARNVVSARLWADVVKSRADYESMPELFRTTPNQGAVDGFPVKVYAAGVYQGRYTLNIPKDKWTFNMDDKLNEHCVLCGENYVSGCFRAAANINESDWTDEIHDVVPDSIKTRWNQVISFVMNSTDDEFRSNLGNYFFVDSLIDYYLFGLASCGLDAFGKNQIYATYDGQKWIASMYDMDSTWGLYWNGSKFVATDYARTSYEDMVDGRQGNLLYMRLEQLFHEELKTRWEELKNGVLSIENIINHFERFTDIAPAELVKEDYASTTGGGKFTGIPSQNTNNIQQIRSYALARHTWCDTYVSALSGGAVTPDDPDVPDESVPCTGITLSESSLTFTEVGSSQTLVATVEPTNATYPVVWSVSPSGVATVSDGVVTAVSDGSCVITATCGGKSATCNVSVIGLSNFALYSLPTETELDGTKVIDTGVKLFENDIDYTICFDVTPGTQITTSLNAMFACNVEQAPYPGIVFRIKGGSNYQVVTGVNEINIFGIPSDTTERFKGVITHKAGGTIEVVLKTESGNAFGYSSGVNACNSGLSETMIIGGAYDASGNYWRKWVGTVHAFKIYDGVATLSELKEFLGENLLADAEWSDSASYKIDSSGNIVSGGSNYVMTNSVAVTGGKSRVICNIANGSYTYLGLAEYDDNMGFVTKGEGGDKPAPYNVTTNSNTKRVRVTAYPNMVSTNNIPAAQIAMF